MTTTDPLDSLKDPKSYDDTWKTEFRKEKYG